VGTFFRVIGQFVGGAGPIAAKLLEPGQKGREQVDSAAIFAFLT